MFNFCVENCYVLAILGKQLKFSVWLSNKFVLVIYLRVSSHIQVRYFVLDILFSLQSCFVFNGVQHLPPFFFAAYKCVNLQKIKKKIVTKSLNLLQSNNKLMKRHKLSSLFLSPKTSIWWQPSLIFLRCAQQSKRSPKIPITSNFIEHLQAAAQLNIPLESDHQYFKQWSLFQT